MQENGNVFDRLDQLAQQADPRQLLTELEDHLRRTKCFHELFEARKLAIRQRRGLPLLASDLGEQLPEAERDAMETELLDACWEVGRLLWQDARLRDGWHYLRAIADRGRVERLFAEIEPGEGNVDEFLELSIHEGLDLSRGFRTLIDRYGTCNAITTFDSAMYGRPRGERAVGAAMLVRHIYEELRENILAHIQRQEGQQPETLKVSNLLDQRDWVFAGGSYHLDTTHLA
ncbi:MAG: hypothetical protein KDA37_13260 [Planctomycetales bacterium]|nr:hypothetical protein [Planctomycetales bacterium]